MQGSTIALILGALIVAGALSAGRNHTMTDIALLCQMPNLPGPQMDCQAGLARCVTVEKKSLPDCVIAGRGRLRD